MEVYSDNILICCVFIKCFIYEYIIIYKLINSIMLHCKFTLLNSIKTQKAGAPPGAPALVKHKGYTSS